MSRGPMPSLQYFFEVRIRMNTNDRYCLAMVRALLCVSRPCSLSKTPGKLHSPVAAPVLLGTILGCVLELRPAPTELSIPWGSTCLWLRGGSSRSSCSVAEIQSEASHFRNLVLPISSYFRCSLWGVAEGHFHLGT